MLQPGRRTEIHDLMSVTNSNDAFTMSGSDSTATHRDRDRDRNAGVDTSGDDRERCTPQPGIDILPEDVLDQHLKPVCSLPIKLSLFQVSRLFNGIMAAGMPRQTVIVMRYSDTVRCRRAVMSRLSREPPSLEEHQAPVHMRLHAESELSLEYCTNWTNIPVQEVLNAVEVVVAKMQRSRAQPFRTFRICSVPSTDDAMRSLMVSFPLSVQATVHTLCARHLEVSLPMTSTSLFPFSASVFPLVTTVKLHKTGVDFGLLQIAAPHLTSLQLSECPRVDAWDKLAEMTVLQDLRLSAYNIFSPTTGLAMRTALDAVSTATWLSSIRLMGFGVQGAAALTGFTRLTSLGLSSMQNDISEPDLFSSHLALIAKSSPMLRELCLLVRPGVSVPTTWRHLENLHVSHRTLIPYLPSMRVLAIDKTLAPHDLYPLDYVVLTVLPCHLVSLRAAYNALLSAVGCHSLRQITWTPATRDGEFQLGNHISLLVAVDRGMGAWPLLDTLLILQESPVQSGPRITKEDREVQSIYNAQLLQTLASRTTPCRITHVTIQQGEHGVGTFEALCRMPSLRSVTLIGMVVNITRLRNLLRLPGMRMLELIGVLGVDSGQVEMLRQEAHPGGKVISMELSAMDVAREGGLDWA